MGLICPKCHTDNLLTAVFCRGCGDKLDLNAMKPEDLLKDEHSKVKKQGATTGQKIFVGVFFGLLALIVLMALCPVGANGLEEGEPDASMASSFAQLARGKSGGTKKKGKKGAKAAAEGSSSVAGLTFDNGTASKLLSKAMQLPKEEWPQGPFVPQHFSVGFNADGTVKIVVKAKAFGALPVACSAKGTFVKAENGSGYECSLSSPKLGILPLFVGGEVCTELIQALGASCQAVQAAKRASEITITEGSVTIKP